MRANPAVVVNPQAPGWFSRPSCVLRMGCQWQALPRERFGNDSAIHQRFLIRKRSARPQGNGAKAASVACWWDAALPRCCHKLSQQLSAPASNDRRQWPLLVRPSRSRRSSRTACHSAHRRYELLMPAMQPLFVAAILIDRSVLAIVYGVLAVIQLGSR